MITFKYNNKQYTTNNLLKKLKKLGITEEDIEIMGTQINELDDSINKRYFTNGIVTHVIAAPKNITKEECFKSMMWNEEMKTGDRKITPEYLKTLYETSVNLLNKIELLAIELEVEDTQDYLNWKDEINRISIDRDRETLTSN